MSLHSLSVAAVVVGAVLAIGSVVACAALGGLPSISFHVPLSTPWSTSLLVGGASAIAVGMWLIARVARRGRRTRDSAAAPRGTNGGGAAAKTLHIPLRAGRALVPPGLARPDTTVVRSACTGVRVERAAAASAFRGGVEAAAFYSRSPRYRGGVGGRAVAAPDWNPEAATTELLARAMPHTPTQVPPAATTAGADAQANTDLLSGHAPGRAQQT